MMMETSLFAQCFCFARPRLRFRPGYSTVAIGSLAIIVSYVQRSTWRRVIGFSPPVAAVAILESDC